MKFLAFLLLFVTSFCSAQLKFGTWRGSLLLDPKNQLELPFTFEIKQNKGKLNLIIQNAKERIIKVELINETNSLK